MSKLQKARFRFRCVMKTISEYTIGLCKSFLDPYTESRDNDSLVSGCTILLDNTLELDEARFALRPSLDIVTKRNHAVSCYTN